MIIDALVDFLMGLWDGFVAWLQTLIPPPPAWLAGWADTISAYASNVLALSPFFPFGLLATVLVLWLVCVVAGLVIKVVRMGLSLVTAGGGSAG